MVLVYYGQKIAEKLEKARFTCVDVKPLSDAALRHNAAALEYCRTSVSAVSGSTAGIMGLTGFYGFAFYFITALMMSVSVELRRHCFLFLVEEPRLFFVT